MSNRSPRIMSVLLSIASLAAFAGCASHAARARGPELNRILENREASYRIDVLPSGHGSGVVISREGHILTAYHVVEDDEENLSISIVEGDGAPVHHRATVIATDPARDLAVIKIERTFRRPAVIEDIRNVHAGDAVYNIGYPYNFGEIVGRGYVMRMSYTMTGSDGEAIRDVMLVDVPDGPGTSGSAVFAQASGRVVGIMRMMLWVTRPGTPPFLVRVITPADQIRAFLDANRIPYLTDGTGSAPSSAATSDVAETTEVIVVHERG